MTDRSYRFSHAIAREPADSAVAGLRAVDTGAPDIALMRQHHAAYVAALRATGAEVLVLPAQEAFPDAHFVEDSAVCFREGAVMMRPGTATRLMEPQEMAPVLARFYDDVQWIGAPATIDGGDVLVTETEVLVGRSARTNAEGIAALAKAAAKWGYRTREVVTPPGVLHFKTDCSLLDETTIYATPLLAGSGCFDGYRVILTPRGEEASANLIRFNDSVVMPDGFPKAAELLAKEGYNVTRVGNSECAKLDGGMSCLSLRFSPPRKG